MRSKDEREEVELGHGRVVGGGGRGLRISNEICSAFAQASKWFQIQPSSVTSKISSL